MLLLGSGHLPIMWKVRVWTLFRQGPGVECVLTVPWVPPTSLSLNPHTLPMQLSYLSSPGYK